MGGPGVSLSTRISGSTGAPNSSVIVAISVISQQQV
jgi:hypothetical protein